MGEVEDETQRIHKRISDLSLAVIATSLVVIVLSCGVCMFNLEEIIRSWSRIF